LPQLLCFLQLGIGERGGLGARLHKATALGRDGGFLIHIEVRSISAGIAAVAMGFALGLSATYVVGPASAGLGAVLARISDFGAVRPENSDLRSPVGSQVPKSSGMRLASLEPGVGFESAIEESQAPSAGPRAPLAERFLVDQNSASFDERFAGAISPGGASAKTVKTEQRANNVRPPDVGGNAIPRSAVDRSAPKLASVTSSPPADVAKKRIRTADLSKDPSLPSGADSRTAIYDIAAHTVYLPNGRRLEAHSGLGSLMDDARYVNVRREGPTPPNVYDLTLREELFHGVRAIRLNPVDDGKMFGRDGMLAHTYMLGPNGQSNGCVSFSDYPAFLNAYLNGEVNRLVVVEHLASPPANAETASGWFPDIIKNLFGRS
jgi:Protein of unknown function (DUF2778)